MRHRTQLYLDDEQYRWLKRRAGSSGSIAAVVRDLIEGARARRGSPTSDPLVRYLIEDPPGDSGAPSTVDNLDDDLYG